LDRNDIKTVCFGRKEFISRISCIIKSRYTKKAMARKTRRNPAPARKSHLRQAKEELEEKKSGPGFPTVDVPASQVGSVRAKIEADEAK